MKTSIFNAISVNYKSVCKIPVFIFAAFFLSCIEYSSAQETPSIRADDSFPLPNTAFFYLTKPQDVLGMVVGVNISNAVPSSLAPDNNFVCFECSTMGNDGSDGGKILIMVPQWKAGDFFAKYYTGGKSKKSQSLSARFVNYTWRDSSQTYVLIVEQ